MSILEHWQSLSAHREHWENRNNPYVYEYDPTDDGPEVATTNGIFANASQELREERDDVEMAKNEDRMLANLIEFLHEDLFQRRLAKTQG